MNREDTKLTRILPPLPSPNLSLNQLWSRREATTGKGMGRWGDRIVMGKRKDQEGDNIEEREWYKIIRV